MDGESPNGFKECVRKDVFSEINRVTEERIKSAEKDIKELRDDIYRDMATGEDKLSKEITYKTSILQKMFIFMIGGLGAMVGSLWSEIIALKDSFIDHDKLPWHSGTNLIVQDVEQLMCKAFQVYC